METVYTESDLKFNLMNGQWLAGLATTSATVLKSPTWHGGKWKSVHSYRVANEKYKMAWKHSK